MVTILQVFYSIFSGVLLSLAIPNEFFYFGFPFISFFALIPFYIAIKYSKNYKNAFFIGFIQTTTTHLLSSFWLAYFKDFAIMTLGASAFGTGLFGGLLGLLFYVPYESEKSKNRLNEYSLSVCFFNSTLFRILYFAGVYTIYEWVKSSGFLGYPWGTIASTMYNWPIIMQLAAITGIYGIGFIFAFSNGILSEIILLLSLPDIKNASKPKEDIYSASKLFGILFACIFIYGVYECSLTRIPQKYISTIIVQQNSDPWKESTDEDSILASQNLTDKCLEELTENGKKADLVMWSEGTLKYTLPTFLRRYEKIPLDNPLLPYVRKIKTPLLVGGSWVRKNPETNEKKYYNSAFVFDKEGFLRGHYAKNHLVPCAEVIPFNDLPAVRNFMTKILRISAGWQPGDQYVFFDIPCSYNPDRILPAVDNFDLSQSYSDQTKKEYKAPTAKISTPVCFDDCFPDIMRKLFLNGCEVFMNITDDSWSLKKSSEYQHFVNSSYSCIEYRTTMVRSTNAGYSVVIDPTGKVLADLPLFEQASLSFDVPVYERHMTTYARFGNWLPYLLIFLCAVYCFFYVKNFKESDYIPSERKIKKSKKTKKSKKSKKENINKK